MASNDKVAKFQEERDKFIDDLVKDLENGKVSWRKEWKYEFQPQNPVTKTIYKGSNAIRLYVASIKRGFEDDRFITYLQAKENGWQVKKGAKSVVVEKFLLYDKQTKKTFNEESIKNLSSSEKRDYKMKNVIPIVKTFNVFNASEIEGIPPLERKEKINDFNKIDKILENSGVKIVYGGGEAYYRASTDEIHLPSKNAFKTENGFYSTALHELSHSTGHETRFNRNLTGKFGSKEYAKEEIIAELSSTFSGMKLPLKFDSSVFNNSKAYLQEWAKVLKEDKNIFFESAKIADKVSEHIVKLQNTHSNDLFKNYTKQDSLHKIIEETAKKYGLDEQKIKNSIVENKGNGLNPIQEKIMQRRNQENQNNQGLNPIQEKLMEKRNRENQEKQGLKR